MHISVKKGCKRKVDISGGIIRRGDLVARGMTSGQPPIQIVR